LVFIKELTNLTVTSYEFNEVCFHTYTSMYLSLTYTGIFVFDTSTITFAEPIMIVVLPTPSQFMTYYKKTCTGTSLHKYRMSIIEDNFSIAILYKL